MPAPSIPSAKKVSRKARIASVIKKKSRARRAATKKLPSFGEWARRYAGMIKNAPPDLSMREGFGD
jgi:hypothetical protein